MSQWSSLNERLDKTRIYLVGSNEWTEMMIALYEAVVACFSSGAYDIAESVIALMEGEIDAMLTGFGFPGYEDQIAARETSYRFGEDFADGDNRVETRFKNW